MKKTFILTALTLGLTASSFAQGFFSFDNSAIYDGTANSFLPFVGTPNHAGEGTAGQILGSGASPSYDVAYLFMNGTTLSGQTISPTAFMTAGATFGDAFTATVFQTTFSSTTGDFVGGAGIVSAGSVRPFGATSTVDGQLITIQVVAWFDPNGSTSFATALANGFNTGGSTLTTIRLAQGTDNVIGDLSAIQGFGVTAVAVPEPTTLALAGLGGAALLAFRRRKA